MIRRVSLLIVGIVSVTASLLVGLARAADDVLKPGGDRPKDAIVLFDGTSTDAWDSDAWPVKDGIMTSAKHDISTTQKFQDVQLHVEFNEPALGPEVVGQNRGNSGVYIQGRYEIQILDSYKTDLKFDSCASVYRIQAPSKNASKPPGEWQTYDITFHAAKFENGKKVKDASVTVYWNGELVQDNTDIPHKTGSGDAEAETPAHLRLQYHRNSVKFRNIWIVPTGDQK